MTRYFVVDGSAEKRSFRLRLLVFVLVAGMVVAGLQGSGIARASAAGASKGQFSAPSPAGLGGPVARRMADRPEFPKTRAHVTGSRGDRVRLGYRQIHHADGSLSCVNTMKLVPISSKPCIVSPRDLVAKREVAGRGPGVGQRPIGSVASRVTSLAQPNVALSAVITDKVALTATSDTPLASGQFLAIYEPLDHAGASRLATVATAGATAATALAVPRAKSGQYIAVIGSGTPPATYSAAGSWIAVSGFVYTPSWNVANTGPTTIVTNYVEGGYPDPATGLSVIGDAKVGVYNIQSTSTTINLKESCSQQGTTCQIGNPAPPCTLQAVVAPVLPSLTWPANPYAFSGSWKCADTTGSTLTKTSSCDAADPVNTANGAFHDSFVDAQIPGRGPWLCSMREYDSGRASVNGWFGWGWSSSYEARLEIGPGPLVRFVDQKGNKVAFARLPDGTYSLGVDVYGSLELRADGTYKLSDWRSRLAWIFSSTGRLTSITDLNGETTTITYGATTVTVTEPAGRTLVFTFNGNPTAAGSHVVSITDPMGRVRNFTYNASTGDLATAADRDKIVSTFTYNASHQLTKRVSGKGGTVTNTYTVGKVTKQDVLKAAGVTRTTTLSYVGDPNSTAGSTTTVVDDHGVTTKYNYVGGTLSSVVSAWGTAAEATSSFLRDPVTHLVTQVTNPMGKISTFAYDSRGNLTKMTDPLNHTTEIVYNTQNQLTCVVAADRYAVGLRCPASGTPTPLGATGMSYDSAGNLLSRTDPNGNMTTYAHNIPAHPQDVGSITDAEGRVVILTYDNYGNLATTTTTPIIGVASTSQRVFNADGQPTCLLAPTQYAAGVRCPAPGASVPLGATGLEYEPSTGLKSAEVNPVGGRTTYGYDADNNITSTTGVVGATTSTVTTTYDFASRPLTRTVGAGSTSPRTTTWAYDLAPAATGNCLNTVPGSVWCAIQTDSAGKVTTYYYTARGRLAGLNQPGNRLQKAAYRKDDQVAVVTSPSGTTLTAAYYDDGRLQSLTPSTTMTPISYTYFPDGQRASMTDGTGTTNYTYDFARRPTSITDGANQTVGYGWDKSNGLKTLTYPSGRIVTNNYDGAGRMTSVNDGAGHTTTFTLNASGAIMGISYPNGNNATLTRNAAEGMSSHTLKNSTGNTLASLAWTRNTFNLVTGETGTGATAGTASYGYDPQLRMNSGPGGAYTFDSGNNVTGLGGPTQTFNATGDGRLATSSNGGVQRTFTYDANGNLDLANVTAGTGSILDPAYDALGRMTSVVVTPTGGTASTTSYAYNGDNLRTSTTKTTTTRYAYNLTTPIPQLISEGNLDYIYGPDGLPIEQIDATNTTVAYFSHDQHGDTRVLTGPSGAITATYSHTPYGVSTRTSGTDSTTLQYGYGHTDTETGYIYLINRYLDPATGQFTTIDPLNSVTGTPYGYGQNTPLNTWDPLGLSPAGQGYCGPGPLGICDSNLTWDAAQATSYLAFRMPVGALLADREAVTGVKPSLATRLGVKTAAGGLANGLTQVMVDYQRTDLSGQQRGNRAAVAIGIGIGAAAAGELATTWFISAGVAGIAATGGGLLVAGAVVVIAGWGLNYLTDHSPSAKEVLGDWKC
jgi:RHS repeat-associated protein